MKHLIIIQCEFFKLARTYTKADLVSFGNFMTSPDRQKRFKKHPLKDKVWDADIANWKEENNVLLD